MLSSLVVCVLQLGGMCWWCVLSDALFSALNQVAEPDATWDGAGALQDVVEILITMDAMERDTLRVLPLGLLSRSIQVGIHLL